jgi:predicted anti-sigma-YlaC factor YlaD
MNTCAKYRLLISRALDNDLDPTELLNMNNHIARCAKCRQVKEDYSLLQVLVAPNNAGTMVVPVETVYVRDHRALSHASWKNIATWKSGLAGACAAILVTLVLLQIPGYRLKIDSRPVCLLENSSVATMAMPLASIVYYEEFAGRSVHSQFVSLTPRSGDHDALQKNNVFYESPLFNDSLLIATRYDASLPGGRTTFF